MTKAILDQIKRFQEFLVELGVARNVLALPAPRMLAIEDRSFSGDSLTAIYSRLVLESEIVEVSRDLFASGHFNLAVAEAFKSVDKYVSEGTGIHEYSGTKLMEKVFSPSNPHLCWSTCGTSSELDEQKGYQRLYSGAMLGIRNPTTHEFKWIDDPEIALELLVFAQHLLRKAKIALRYSDSETTA